MTDPLSLLGVSLVAPGLIVGAIFTLVANCSAPAGVVIGTQCNPAESSMASVGEPLPVAGTLLIQFAVLVVRLHLFGVEVFHPRPE